MCVEPKQKLRQGPWGGGKQWYLVPSTGFCLWRTAQFIRSEAATLACGRAMSFFLKHACAGDWGPPDAADGGERGSSQAAFS